jgi:hypothetical protein
MKRVVREATIHLAVLVGLSVLILGALEAYLRLTIPASSRASIYEYTTQTKRYKVMKPSASIVAWGKELRTNDLGFRDNAPTIPAKKEGEYRIIVLGDSFTVAAGVDHADLYTTQLEKRLRATNPQVKVINLAVGGYNVLQYALVLQEVGLGLDPDMVVVALFPNNDFDNQTYDDNLRIASGQAPAVQPQPWHESTYLYRAYGIKVESKLTRLLRAPAASDPGKAQREWDQNSAALKQIAFIARERNLALEVAVLPNTWSFERERPLFARVEVLCRELELACLDLLERFAAAGIAEGTLRLNAIDSHPNERYNAFVAAQLSEHLARKLPFHAGH